MFRPNCRASLRLIFEQVECTIVQVECTIEQVECTIDNAASLKMAL